VRAAVAIADADGLGAVTIRTVATRLGAGVMSLYSYVPDKQTLVYDMVEQVSGELELPEPSGDWRADMHLLARGQRALIHRHPWLPSAISHLQPLGPAVLAALEFALAALEPTGLTPGERLETFSLLNGFVVNLVRAELGTAADPGAAQAQSARLPELLGTGRYPRFAAALAEGGPAGMDLTAHFERLLDRILDGIVRPAAAAPEAGDAIGWIREIVLDTPDPRGLAEFWAGLLGGTPVQWYPGWVTLEPPPHGQRLSFQGAAGAATSAAGAAGGGAPVHFDVLVSDLAGAHDRVVAAGAIPVGEHVSPRPGPGGQAVQWRVYQDPAGHRFCLVVR
jgi:AcrR family transcriptional regulator